MRTCLAILVTVCSALAPSAVSAQSGAYAVAVSSAPVYLNPAHVVRGPLRTAAQGTRFRVLSVEAEWVNVEFNDPQHGQRIGWVRRSVLRIDDASRKPVDLSVALPASPPASAPVRDSAMSTPIGVGQRVDVEILDRRDSESVYSYVIPGSMRRDSDANVACYSFGPTSVNCRASGTSTSTFVPARSGEYTVRGATFTLRLPNRMLAVVNCESKYAWPRMRSCRRPMMGRVQAEFNGDKAKLLWSVSIDGRKLQSETYRIVGVVEGR